jgi:hypothetical protein
MTSAVMTLVASCVTSALAFHAFGSSIAVFVGVVSIVSIGVFAAATTESFAIHPAPSFATYRGLSNMVVAHNYARLNERFDAWNRADVWRALQIIIVEQLGVKPELVTREARFVDDLGAG